MPELPDVEAYLRVFDGCAGGRQVRRVEVRDSGVLRGMTAAGLRRELTGRRFGRPERRGKWLLAPTGGPTLLLHFGMTGELVCAEGGRERHPHDRVVFVLGGGRELRFRDQRKLKGLWLAHGLEDERRVIGDQGPDAGALSRAGLDAALAGHRGRLKPTLTDQSVLAGLGNLLADEILWRARLHPRTPVPALSDAQRGRLHRDMRATLRASVASGRVPPGRDWLTGHRDAPAGDCPRCGTRLARGRVGGRGTVWCPHCQREQETPRG
ncbi:Fpg/Nei family DNA glycosylase [Streptomyces sp. NPDC050560]|uniref:Fpg/Nei family DNA glycosylase n=1 Tax=Streptomyces sp. NPDC050560 TaxID=3365630 RepID=UPI0037B64780